MSDHTGHRIDVLVGERSVARPDVAPADGEPAAPLVPGVVPFDHELHSRLELVRTRVRDEAAHLNQVDAVASEYLVTSRPRLRLVR
jgi:hypothetical protein